MEQKLKQATTTNKIKSTATSAIYQRMHYFLWHFKDAKGFKLTDPLRKTLEQNSLCKCEGSRRMETQIRHKAGEQRETNVGITVPLISFSGGIHGLSKKR